MISYGTVFFCGILVVTVRDLRTDRPNWSVSGKQQQNCILKWAVHRSQKTGVLSGQVFNAFLGTLLLPKNNESGDWRTRKLLCFVNARRMSAAENGTGIISNNFGSTSFRTNKGPKDASQYYTVFQDYFLFYLKFRLLFNLYNPNFVKRISLKTL